MKRFRRWAQVQRTEICICTDENKGKFQVDGSSDYLGFEIMTLYCIRNTFLLMVLGITFLYISFFKACSNFKRLF